MHTLVVLMLLEVGDSHMLLSMAQWRCDHMRCHCFARRWNRHWHILHVSTADLQVAEFWEYHGVSALQGLQSFLPVPRSGRAGELRDRESPFGWQLAD
jgi:hypothetical protein